MALPDYALTELSTVKTELGITGSGSDSELERYIKSYSDLLRRASDREFYYVTGHKEKIKSIGDTRILVDDHRPVNSINSITDPDGNTVDSSTYEIEDEHKGIIRLKNDFWQNTGVAIRRMREYPKYFEYLFEVDYDGGWNTPVQASPGPYDLPMHIQEAVITTVVTRFLQKGRQANIDSETIAEASISYSTDTEKVLGQSVSHSFKSVVDRYKDRSVL